MRLLIASLLLAPVLGLAWVPSDALNPDFHQKTVAATICTPGYTKLVRPSTTYTNGVKRTLPFSGRNISPARVAV